MRKTPQIKPQRKAARQVPAKQAVKQNLEIQI